MTAANLEDCLHADCPTREAQHDVKTLRAQVMADIRLANVGDLPEILEITNRAIRETPANFHTDARTLEELTATWTDTHDTYPWVVADVSGHVVGFASSGRYKAKSAYDWTAEVTVYVRQDHRGGGLGRRMYTMLLSILEGQGYGTVVGAIVLPNPASVGLHQSLGFSHVGTLARAGWKFGRWHDVSYWQVHFAGGGLPPTRLKKVADVARSDDAD